MPIRVLLRLPHGLGDCVQFTVVLKHLAKYRPDWVIDVKVGRGKHSALAGLCNRVWHDDEKMPPDGHYQQVADLGWFENYCKYDDRPNSKITNCLAEVFGVQYDASLGRYEVRQSAEARASARSYLESVGCVETGGKFNAVILHYEGNTSSWKKNLKHWQAKRVVDAVLAAGRVPVLLDWDNRSPLADQKTVYCPRCGDKDIWGGFGSGDAATIAALITLSEAYVGIDSGPGKVASATKTPSLICWVGHHPVQFHDPAPNTTHLVPARWRSISPADHVGVADYFAKHYLFRTYPGELDLADEACRWLRETLGVEPPPEEPQRGVRFVLPQGIGDSVWALTKIRYLADGPIDVILSGDSGREIDRRTVPFLKRFPFLNSVEVLDVPIHLDPCDEGKNDEKGRYRYVPDGRRGGFHFLMPNGPLERGVRLEDWLPELPCDWDIMDAFDWSGTQRGKDLAVGLDPFVAFYLGPESGHTEEGHNRGWLWKTADWVRLGKMFHERGQGVVVVGAPYDRSFWENYVRPAVREKGMAWADVIGKLEIGETLALLRGAKCVVSYQCGLGIVSHYLGQRVAMWWRPDGDSCHPKRMVSFDERMKDAWTNPKFKDNYLGLVYGRETPGDIMAEIDRRGWLK